MCCFLLVLEYAIELHQPATVVALDSITFLIYMLPPSLTRVCYWIASATLESTLVPSNKVTKWCLPLWILVYWSCDTRYVADMNLPITSLWTCAASYWSTIFVFKYSKSRRFGFYHVLDTRCAVLLFMEYAIELHQPLWNLRSSLQIQQHEVSSRLWILSRSW